MRVAVAARTPDKPALLELERDHGVRRYGCDASDPSAVAGLFEAVGSALGKPNLVVHNIDGRTAEIFRKGIHEADHALVRQVLDNSGLQRLPGRSGGDAADAGRNRAGR